MSTRLSDKVARPVAIRPANILANFRRQVLDQAVGAIAFAGLAPGLRNPLQPGDELHDSLLMFPGQFLVIRKMLVV